MESKTVRLFENFHLRIAKVESKPVKTFFSQLIHIKYHFLIFRVEYLKHAEVKFLAVEMTVIIFKNSLKMDFDFFTALYRKVMVADRYYTTELLVL